MKQILHILLLSLALSIITGCTASSIKEETPVFKEVKIAVVLPADNRERWERMMNLARKNISEATDLLPIFEFYDEDSHDIMTLAYDLARDESIISVIGCESDTKTETLAYQMSRLRTLKPMFTFNTSQEVIRKYSRQGFMWGLSESDITQSEVILAQIAQTVGSKEVALLACSTPYGQTFVDWFAFQARELGLEPVRICQYNNITEITGYLDELTDFVCPIVCVPNTAEEAAEMAKHPRLFMPYFSHKAFSDKTIEILKNTAADDSPFLQGVTLVPDPATGFQNIYEARYNNIPTFGEAQLYDAIMITCFAYAVADIFGITVNEATAKLLEQDELVLGTWNKSSIKDLYSLIVNENIIPAISGASGYLSFHPSKHTIIQYSTYAVQYMSNFKFYQTDFISRADGTNTSSVHGAWEWNKYFDQDFDPFQEDADLKPLKGNKAILIAASGGWTNYRHQADILSYYHFLKENGFSDNDIILIMADDLAYNNNNPYPGKITGIGKSLKNLYENVNIDYKLGDLTPQELRSVLLGEPSEKLPAVLESDDRENLLLVWSGHGKPQTLLWDENLKSLNAKYLKDILQEMHKRGKYRKMFGIIETCYSGSVAMECAGIPKMLLMTATNDKETSKAEHYDTILGTYVTNSFSAAVLNAIEKNIELSIKDLYTEAFSMTMGSHVTLYNVEQFGNVFTNYVDEYFTAQ